MDLTQGFGYAMWLHRDIDFEGLRGYRPFTDILATEKERAYGSGAGETYLGRSVSAPDRRRN
jgi:hypothetical protein